MTKRQLIDEIVLLNPTAKPGFLAQFDGEDLDKYLHQLEAVRAPRIPGVQSRLSGRHGAGASRPPSQSGPAELSDRAPIRGAPVNQPVVSA